MNFMDSYSIFSLLPLIGSVFILYLASFVHLNFKLIDIKKVQIVTAVLGGIFGITYFSSMYRLNVNFGLLISEIHFILAGLLFTLSVILGFYTRRITPTMIQILGLCLFGGSFLFLLA